MKARKIAELDDKELAHQLAEAEDKLFRLKFRSATMALENPRLIPNIKKDIALITVVYLIGSAFRRTRQAFHDERMGELTGTGVAFQALIEVPFGTVLLEEIAFRAVLFSMLARRFGLVWAIVLSSIVFGLWHILPSWGTHEQNPALGSVAGEGARGNVIAISLSVLTTAVAGVLFAALRLVSGSVLAPMGFHWATNGLGYAFSWLLIRAQKKHFGPSHYTAVEIVGLFWHVVDIVWIFLFPLLYLIERHA